MTRTTLNLMSCLVLLSAISARTAFAKEDEEIVEKVAVRNRLFSVAGRWEVGANVGFSLLPKLTDHYNLNASVAVNPKDWLGIELRGGYAISRLTSLATQIQEDFFTSTSSKEADDAADIWRMSWNVVAGIRFQPIYGKINLMSELPIHFQFYLWVGGGVTGLTRESMVICPDRAACLAYFDDPSLATPFATETKVSPLVSIALGFRFFLPFSGHSIKFEARDWSYLDSFQENIPRTCTTGVRGCPTATAGAASPNAGITNLVQFDLGYSFIF
jgi:outer membrane beta-barrel protein